MIRRRTSPQEPSEQLALAPIVNFASAATAAFPSGAAAGCRLHHSRGPNAPPLAREWRVGRHPRMYGPSVALAIRGCHRPVSRRANAARLVLAGQTFAEKVVPYVTVGPCRYHLPRRLRRVD